MDACNAAGFSLSPEERDALSQVLIASYLSVQPNLTRARQEFGAFVAGGFKAPELQPLLGRLAKVHWDGVWRLREEAQREGVRIVTFFDEGYPESIRQIPDPPLALFIRGLVANRPRIAIVGSRRSTPYGERVANTLATFLDERGIAVVSGLARGIDTAAHAGCPSGIAVFGGGLLNVYPAENRPLAARMLEAGGALISEYGLTTPSLKAFFPERNRLVSALSHAVVIVEAEERSGALITARIASEQGREVFAVPGPIASESSRGTHRLIRDGAQILVRYEDLLEQLPGAAVAAVERRGKARVGLSGTEPRLMERIDVGGVELLAPAERIRAVAELLRDGLVHDFDEIMLRVGRSVGEVTSVLSELELYGAIRVLPGRRFQYDDYVDMPDIFKQILNPA